MPERRRAVAFLGLGQIARILALPDGLRVVACRDDFLRDGVAVLIEGDALDPQPEAAELPRIPAKLLDRTELAMRAEVSGWDRDDGRNVMVSCPDCAWTQEWGYGAPMPTLGQLAGAVSQHSAEAHAGQ